VRLPRWMLVLAVWAWTTAVAPHAVLAATGAPPTPAPAPASTPTPAPAPVPGPAPRDLPDPATIVDAYVTASGGRAAYENVFNRVATGTMELVGLGVKGTVTEYAEAPYRNRLVMDAEGIGKIEAGTGDGLAWEADSIQGARLLEGEERAAALREATFNRELHWRQLYKDAVTAGIDSLDGRPCYKVVLTPQDGRPESWWFDLQSHLLVKSSTIVETMMGDVPVETAYEDYRPVDGLLLPHANTQTLLVQKIRIVLQSIQHNLDLPAGCFDPPPEVRALLQPAAAPGPPKQ
jgi:hypothetical protein